MRDKQQPREKLIKYGKESLSDEELLAIMLSSGTKGESVYALAGRLLQEYSLRNIFEMNYASLSRIRGIKQAKACKLMAAFEIAKRCMQKQNENIALVKSEAVYDYVKPFYAFSAEEKILVLYLDVKCRTIMKKEYQEEHSCSVELPVKSIIKEAINNACYGIILVHNHPSGDVHPSCADVMATKKLAILLEELKILFLDHLIIGPNSYYSFADEKLLN